MTNLLVLLLFFKFHIDDFLEKWDPGTKVLPLFPSHWLHRLRWWILYWPRFLKRKVRGIRREKAGSYGVICRNQLKTGFLWLSFWHFYVNIVSWSPDLIVKRALSQYPQWFGAFDIWIDFVSFRMTALWSIFNLAAPALMVESGRHVWSLWTVDVIERKA